MKVEVNETANKNEMEYPCLMKGHGGLVLLMTDEKTGMVISPNHSWEIGEYDIRWGGLKPFHGTITLSNE